MSFFITLVELTDAKRREIESVPKVQSMIHHGLSAPEYHGFLHDLYHIVWHFCPIMAAAAARCDDRFRHVRMELYERIQEEKGHEEWVLSDIKAVGGDVAAALRMLPPSPPAHAMIGFNYYAVERLHPCSVLGMLYTLEVISSVYGGRTADAISKSLGREISQGGFRFLSSHATMDVDHMASLSRLIKTVEDAAAQDAIVHATRVNLHQFGQLFQAGGALSA